MGEIRQKISVGRTGKWVRVNMVFDSGATASYLKESIAKRIQAPKFQVIETILGDGSIVEGYLSQIKLKMPMYYLHWMEICSLDRILCR